MNSYNENLQTSIATSLQALQLEQKSLQSTRDAAMFSLYYAEGAKITAAENLTAANNKCTAQQAIKEQAVTSNNIAVNLLNSVTQQKAYASQSVTNTAVNASNVQIAANAIIKLSADIGSIHSILKAADLDTEIYNQGAVAYEIISDTATAAETLSQHSMEASGLTAFISTPAVADEVKAASTAMANFLAVASADYDTLAATVTTENSAMATASAAEKQAEGQLEFINAEYVATTSAYYHNNKELNLSLRVPEKYRSDDSYKVIFSHYHSPFPASIVKSKPGQAINESYPVKNYYVMLVKESKKTLFTVTNAEGLLLDAKQYVKIPVEKASDDKQTGQKGEQETEVDILINQLNDSDGDQMELGKNYVVFVFAELMDEYKKAINDFDDFLSAPSAPFALTTQLDRVDGKSITHGKNKIAFTIKESTSAKNQAAIKVKPSVKYRMFFLPADQDLTNGLLSESGLRTLEADLENLQQIAGKYEPEILKLEVEQQTLQAMLNGLYKQKAEGGNADLDKTIADVEAQITAATKALKKTNTQMEAAKKTLTQDREINPGFFFTLKIAEQIPASNYDVAEAKNKDGNQFEVDINESTTDNFGNRLVDGRSYTPVVLTVADVPEENQQLYSSALSDQSITKPITYIAN